MDRIVIKRVGLISKLGKREEQVLKHLENNTYLSQDRLDFENFLDNRKTRRMNRIARMLTSTIYDCMDGLKPEDSIIPADTGIIVNVAYGAINTTMDFGRLVNRKTPELASPTDFANSVSNAIIGHAAMYYGLKGPSTLLMGGNTVYYTMRLLKRQDANEIFCCGVEEYCKPIHEYAAAKYKTTLFGEGAAALLLSNQGKSEYGYILGGSETGLGYSPLFTDSEDETGKFSKLIMKTIQASNVDEKEIDCILLGSDSCSGLRTAEEKAVDEIFTGKPKIIPVKDLLGETLGAGMTLSIAVAAILIRSGQYKKILVNGIEVSGTLESFVLSCA